MSKREKVSLTTEAADGDAMESPDARPAPSSQAVRRRMQQQTTRDTAAELVLRRELHRRGLRYRVHRRPVPGLRRVADIVFARARVAVFVDGCFWHACPVHATWPRANADWWREKILRNVERDRETDRLLMDESWKVVRVWEHEAVNEAADRVEDEVRRRRG